MAEHVHLGPNDGPEVHVRPSTLPVDTDILAPIDLMRDGGFGDENEGSEPLVINTPVNPDKPVFNLAFVSAVGNNEAEVTVRTPFGKEVVKTMKSQELFMLERQKYGGMKMTEVASKREGTFGNKALTFIERTWKTTLGKPMHEVKERRVGGKLMIAAGVDTAITAEFDAVIDQKARERIGEQRNNWFKRLTGNIRDAGNEIIGREKDLHREKIKIASELRNEYLQDPSDSKHPYAELLNRDMVAREAVAEKFANTPVDFLGEHGDKAREVALAPDSPVAKFLQEKIFKKVIADAIAQSDAGTYDGKNGGISAKLRPELDKTLKDYFFSDEFTTWRNGLSPEEQKVFENSLTYTNNVLSQAETVLMPMVHDHLTYFKTNQDIDFDIKLKLGTGQFGPNNEVVGTSVFSKDRISKNASVYEKLRKSINGDQSKLYTQGDVGKGLKQEMMMAALNAVVSNEVAAAAAGALLGGTAKTLLRSSVAWLPILGSGLVAGGVSGAKEYANLGKMRERFGEQVAEGYTHPVGVNAVRAEALRKVDYHRVDLGLRSEQLQHVSKQLIEGDKSPETILQTLGYLADSKARVALSDKRHINLFHASTDTPSGRGVYQKQEALHTQARILATTKLHELLNGDDALRTEIANKIGFIPTLTSEQILDGLSAFQGEFLEHGITLDVKVQEALKAVTSADVKSIVGQDKAFQKWRWKEVGKRAATSAVLAGATTGLFKLGMSEYNTLHEQAITTVEHKVHTIIDQSVTSHASPLSIGEVQDPNTHEILATMSAHIPKGTTLMADQHVPGAYDLVLTDQPHRVLVDNMTFTDGHLNMTTEIRDSLAHSHIDYHSVSTGEVTIGAPDSSFVGTETLRFGDLPGAHEAGFDQWFANTLNHSFRVNPEPQVAGQMVVDRTTQINGLREMLYAWEDHEKFLGHLNNFHLVEEPGYHQVMHVDAVTGRYLSEPQANGFFMDNVPKILSTEEGHRKIADFINESVRMKLSGANMDQAHEIAYHMSYDGTPGTIPTPQEFEVLMKALGETTAETAAKKVATHDAWFTMADDLVDIQTVTTTEVVNHTIPAWTDALSVSVGNSVPLEAPIGNIKSVTQVSNTVATPASSSSSYGYGYGYRGGARGSVNNIQIETTEEQRIRQNLPNLLVQAFQQWGTPDTEQQHVNGLTWPEQYDWLQNQSRINTTRTNPPTPAQPVSNNAQSLDVLASQLGTNLTPVINEPAPTVAPTVEAAPTPSIETNKSSIPELELFIADENDSPVKPEDKAEAIVRMKEFASLGDLDEAVAKGGIKKENALSLYQQMLTWMKDHKVAELESTDSPAWVKETRDKIDAFSRNTFWTPNPNPVAVKQLSNALMNLLFEFGSKFNIVDPTNEEASTANLFVLFAAYERVKETKYRD